MPKIDPRNIEVIDPAQAALLRQKTMAERIAMIGDSNRTARLLVAAGIRAQHPDWSDERVTNEVLRRVGSGSDRTPSPRH